MRWLQALAALVAFVWVAMGFMLAFTITHWPAEAAGSRTMMKPAPGGPGSLRISARGLAHIKHFEGLRLKSYFCTSQVCTIGWGHTGPDVKPGMVITEEEAERLLLRDLASAEEAVAELVKVPLRQGQWDAICDLVFNIGRDAFAKSTLLKLLNKREYGQAAQQLMRWVHSGSAVIAGLQRRRLAARAMWLEQA